VDQAFSPSYDLTPPPPPPPLLSVSSTDPLEKTKKDRQLADGRVGRRGGVGGGAKSYDGEKAGSSVNHSIHSGLGYPMRAANSVESRVFSGSISYNFTKARKWCMIKFNSNNHSKIIRKTFRALGESRSFSL
jgi:hypothetical protein